MKTTRTNESYEVLSYDARVEVLDDEGREARYTRYERVRFLKSASTIQDYGWGDGIAFAEHEITPGKFAKRRLIRSRLRTTVKLPWRRHPGDELTFVVERIIKNGFVSPEECWLEAELYHPTERLALEVRLPGSRHVRSARLASSDEQKRKRLTVRLTPDGQQTISHRTTSVPVGRRLRLSWVW